MRKPAYGCHCSSCPATLEPPPSRAFKPIAKARAPGACGSARPRAGAAGAVKEVRLNYAPRPAAKGGAVHTTAQSMNMTGDQLRSLFSQSRRGRGCAARIKTHLRFLASGYTQISGARSQSRFFLSVTTFWGGSDDDAQVHGGAHHGCQLEHVVPAHNHGIHGKPRKLPGGESKSEPCQAPRLLDSRKT